MCFIVVICVGINFNFLFDFLLNECIVLVNARIFVGSFVRKYTSSTSVFNVLSII